MMMVAGREWEVGVVDTSRELEQAITALGTAYEVARASGYRPGPAMTALHEAEQRYRSARADHERRVLDLPGATPVVDLREDDVDLRDPQRQRPL